MGSSWDLNPRSFERQIQLIKMILQELKIAQFFYIFLSLRKPNFRLSSHDCCRAPVKCNARNHTPCFKDPLQGQCHFPTSLRAPSYSFFSMTL